MDKKKTFVIAAVIAVAVGGSVYILFSTLEEPSVSTSTKRLEFRDYGKILSVDNTTWTVDAENFSEETVKLSVESRAFKTPSAENADSGEISSGTGESKSELNSYLVSKSAYETAKETSEPVVVFQETRGKTSSPPILPISTALGVAAGILSIAAWLSREKAMGSATSVLLDEGLETMSVQDAEIVGETMRRGEFTIPEIMSETGTSKSSAWRTVKKLEKKGLVEETDKKRAPSQGLGGRGKPSQVYRYVGPSAESE